VNEAAGAVPKLNEGAGTFVPKLNAGTAGAGSVFEPNDNAGFSLAVDPKVNGKAGVAVETGGIAAGVGFTEANAGIAENEGKVIAGAIESTAGVSKLIIGIGATGTGVIVGIEVEGILGGGSVDGIGAAVAVVGIEVEGILDGGSVDGIAGASSLDLFFTGTPFLFVGFFT
jgi:hypothetical protein